MLGLCGGFQMLGREIADPDGIEGSPQTMPGLGYLDFATALTGGKTLRHVNGTAYGAPFEGYEMHVGESTGEALSRPFLRFEDGRPEGAISADGRVAGCYVHGLFASDAFRRAWLASFEREVPPHSVSLPEGREDPRNILGENYSVPSPLGEKDRMRGALPLAYDALIEQTLDELAAHLARHIDMEALLKLAR